ncbi:nuclear transport factor 2 family protein [Nocardia sp. NPDC050175]|uniref:nuclear transport factor 2 family protein n=1 Tax=Nocardia sp. NPDC050175 TaxID=3364317 RepID=UPI0037B354F6
MTAPGNDPRIRSAAALYAALAKGDAGQLDRLLHPEFEGRTTDGLPFGLGGTYRGIPAMRDQFWWQIGKHYLAGAEPSDFSPLGVDGLLVRGRYHGAARSTGKLLDAAFMHVLHFRDGSIDMLEQLTDSARWWEALG